MLFSILSTINKMEINESLACVKTRPLRCKKTILMRIGCETKRYHDFQILMPNDLKKPYSFL